MLILKSEHIEVHIQLFSHHVYACKALNLPICQRKLILQKQTLKQNNSNVLSPVKGHHHDVKVTDHMVCYTKPMPETSEQSGVAKLFVYF